MPTPPSFSPPELRHDHEHWPVGHYRGRGYRQDETGPNGPWLERGPSRFMVQPGARSRHSEGTRAVEPGPGRVRRMLVPGAMVAGACLATMGAAGALERGSAWAGIHAVTAGIGLTGRRPPARFHAVMTPIAVGMIVVGSFVAAGISSRLGRGRAVRGAVASGVAVALDALLMRRTIFAAFAETLGVGGTVVKYAAMGVAAALAPAR
jgi:hypothetical protein